MAALPFCIRLKLLNFGGKFVLLLEYARTFTQCIKAYTFTSPSHGKSSHISEQFDQFGAEIFVQFHQIARKCGFGIFRLISFGQRTFLPCSKLQPSWVWFSLRPMQVGCCGKNPAKSVDLCWIWMGFSNVNRHTERHHECLKQETTKFVCARDYSLHYIWIIWRNSVNAHRSIMIQSANYFVSLNNNKIWRCAVENKAQQPYIHEKRKSKICDYKCCVLADYAVRVCCGKIKSQMRIPTFGWM